MPVVVHAAVGSPAVWGVWRPRLILPADLAEQLTKSELTWVLLHELAHVRRGDLIVALVQRLAQIAYFFHPAVWLVNLAIDRQREFACDDAASAAAGCLPRECGAALVSVVERACGPAPVAALGLFQSQAFLRRRIMRLVNQRDAVPMRLSRASFALLCALAVVVLPRLNASGEPAASTSAAPGAKATADRQRGGRELALADEPQKASDEKPTAPDAPPGDATEPVSLSGRAVDQDGKPVADAVIYLASLVKANRICGKTVTDAQGRYEFRNALLPIAKLSAVGEPEHCAFEVFGRKQGLGFAWSGRRWFFVHAFAKNPQGVSSPQERYRPGETIDLTFSPSARLFGQVVDDRGEPLKGVELVIWGCERLSSDRFAWSEHFSAISNALVSPTLVPAEMRIRETDDDGRFEFDDLPAECRFRIRVRTTNGPTREIWAATTDAPQPADPRAPEILLGELKLIFPRPLDVPFQILFGDSGLPAAKVLVRTYDQSGTGDRGTTDAQGRVTLRLPPGQHKIDLSPVRGTPYFSTPHIFNPVPVGFEVG
ncbi:MAG TPA: M56 family metallopeptidase, partial [Pirellulales bacterium]|nr:M56 family metallopeptidase [Pirellulales bacterium]